MKMSINIVQSIYTIYRKTILLSSILGKFVPKILLFLRNTREFDNKWSFCYTMYSFNQQELVMNLNEYNQLDEVSKLRQFHQFCEKYDLDHKVRDSRVCFFLCLDDSGSTSIVSNNGVVHNFKNGIPDIVA